MNAVSRARPRSLPVEVWPLSWSTTHALSLQSKLTHLLLRLLSFSKHHQHTSYNLEFTLCLSLKHCSCCSWSSASHLFSCPYCRCQSGSCHAQASSPFSLRIIPILLMEIQIRRVRDIRTRVHHRVAGRIQWNPSICPSIFTQMRKLSLTIPLTCTWEVLPTPAFREM